MPTIQNLIDQLSNIENKEQSIIFQYYIAEHFDYEGVGSPTAEQFDKASDDLHHESLWEEAGETVSDYLYGIVNNGEKDEEE